jgi:hypothetical protein
VTRIHTLLGKRVEAVYRFNSLEMLAIGLLLDYTDNSILIEQHADQYGEVSSFQLVIPYAWIIRLSESAPPGSPDSSLDTNSGVPPAPEVRSR